MRFWRQYKFALLFLALLVFCSAMVIRQYNANHTRHAELREAFILLHHRGYAEQTHRLYQRLLRNLETLPTRALLEDVQRTRMLVNPEETQMDNLLWKYHWSVSNELDKRSEEFLSRALNLSEEK